MFDRIKVDGIKEMVFCVVYFKMFAFDLQNSLSSEG